MKHCPDCRKRSLTQTSEDRGMTTTHACGNKRCGTLWTKLGVLISKEIAAMDPEREE